ncbi:YslB family protein [Bacillus shivajii]|uniref:YslB family protein n=1 Tax=Bacillus shivajii TaxID=1983719 RepID=UPI001CFC346B|nr:YslB family protein [Bacillus shivajii]UCZ52184.1 YslB family protein [Bacillus shivajii]
MKKNDLLEQEEKETTVSSTFSYDLLRNVLLPELLGEDEEMILYWGGKSIARRIDSENLQDLEAFFKHAGWGSLSLLKEKKSERLYELVSPITTQDRPISLECGFLAQAIEQQYGFITDASYEIKKKKPYTCRITVKWDSGDPVK